jgi:hypothetical protein
MATEGAEIAPTHGVPDPLWRRIVDDPERAPEMLALAAAERFAGPAEEWVRERSGKRPRSLARTAYRRHVHLSRAEGLALGLGGMVTGAANVAGLGWLQARMVFFIAAAYGHDPRDPMRPAELLWLWGVYDSAEAARASLDGVGESMASTVVKKRLSKDDERSATSKLVRYVGKRTAKRYAGRMVPLLGAPISAIQNGGSTKDLGKAAIAFYGEKR